MEFPFSTADLLLPITAPEVWATVACDQFTSEPDYWEQVSRIVGEALDTYILVELEDALLLIDKESPGKFDHIELDHVTLVNNVDISMGIDLSAQTEATVRDCTIIGSTAAPALVQILPQTQVTMENCTVGDRVFSYQPEKENWQTDPKPLIKKNVTETQEAVFDRVP